MSKKWLLGACGALLASMFAAQSNAGVVINVVLSGIADPATPNTFRGFTGTTSSNWNVAHAADLSAAGLPQANVTSGIAPLLATGEVVRFDIFATITGTDNDPSNEALQYIAGNLTTAKSASTSAGASTGGSFRGASSAAALIGQSPFSGTGTQNGQLFPGQDGNNDMGSPTFTDSFAPYLNMAGAFPPPPYFKWDGSSESGDGVPGDPGVHPTNSAWLPGTWPDDSAGSGFGATPGGIKVKIGTAAFTAGTLSTGKTEINFSAWKDPTSGLPYFKSASWFEDINFANADPGGDPLDGIILGAAQKSPNNGTFSIGNPIILQANLVPEPASLSVLALGALGLLARRRK